MGWKTSLLVRYEVLGLFVKIMTADDKYFHDNKDNLQQPIQMHLSENPKSFLSVFYSIFRIYIKF